MTGLTIGKQFLIFTEKSFDFIFQSILRDLEYTELTRENKSDLVDYFMDNSNNYLSEIFEYNDLYFNEDDIDSKELNILFREFEDYLDYILYICGYVINNKN